MSEVVTGDAVVVEVQVAQPPVRALALLIDFVAQLTLMFGLSWMVLWFASFADPAMLSALLLATNVLVLVGYPTIFETLSRGRSLGKLALGLRVVSDDGSPERFRQALFRGLAAVVEFWMLFGAPALIASLVSQRGKRLGDMFAGTIVISVRPPRDRTQPVMMPPHLAAWATGLELSQLPNDVVATARQYLTRWFDLTPQTQYEMGVRISAQVASYVSPPPPPGIPPHAYLSAVLAERRRRTEIRLARQAATPAGQNPGSLYANSPPAAPSASPHPGLSSAPAGLHPNGFAAPIAWSPAAPTVSADAYQNGAGASGDLYPHGSAPTRPVGAEEPRVTSGGFAPPA